MNIARMKMRRIMENTGERIVITILKENRMVGIEIIPGSVEVEGWAFTEVKVGPVGGPARIRFLADSLGIEDLVRDAGYFDPEDVMEYSPYIFCNQFVEDERFEEFVEEIPAMRSLLFVYSEERGEGRWVKGGDL